jgi:putative phosphoesterase
MKFAVIADIHDNLANLQKFLLAISNLDIDTVLVAGDVARLETLQYLGRNFSGQIFVIKGNADVYEDLPEVTANVHYLGRYSKVVLDGQVFGLCHEPSYFEDVLIESPEAKTIFYGHTHKPWLEDKIITGHSRRLINPGTLGGINYQATFAIYDTIKEGPELINLDNPIFKI